MNKVTFATQCDHCWHDTGQLLLSNPPKMDYVCCWCGEKKQEVIGNNLDTKKHGVFVPMNRVECSMSPLTGS